MLLLTTCLLVHLGQFPGHASRRITPVMQFCDNCGKKQPEHNSSNVCDLNCGLLPIRKSSNTGESTGQNLNHEGENGQNSGKAIGTREV
jgi:hypothetical protein